jgi:inner membrane transporter RhtA
VGRPAGTVAPMTGGIKRCCSSAHQPPAPALIAAGAVSLQLGAAIATHLFSQVGPAGAVTLRMVFGAAAMLVVVRARPSRVARITSHRRDLLVAAAFGVVLAAMNLCFYEALSRIPLAVAVTVEFAGPLAVTIGASRRRTDLVWAVLAGGGVLLLAGGRLFGQSGHLDLAGVGLALLTGVCWAGYILLSAQTGRRFPGSSGLAVAMVVAAVIILPVGVAAAGTRLFRPEVLGLGAVVAVLSSVLPYSFELSALRRVTARAFGILLSMEPAIAALAGLAVLGQSLSGTEVAALVLVAGANAGSSWFDARSGAGRPARPGTRRLRATGPREDAWEPPRGYGSGPTASPWASASAGASNEEGKPGARRSIPTSSSRSCTTRGDHASPP